MLRRSGARLIAVVAVSAIAALAGCGSDPQTSSSGQAATTCEQDTRKDIYTAGLSKQGTAISVKMLEANPAPPSKGTNTMTLEVLDAAGAPLDHATVSVTPFMPDHAHGSAVIPTVQAMGGGKYAVDKVYLPMAGLWRITVTVQVAGSAPQEVAFQFCLEG